MVSSALELASMFQEVNKMSDKQYYAVVAQIFEQFLKMAKKSRYMPGKADFINTSQQIIAKSKEMEARNDSQD